jgi:predicted DNA-binding protein
MRSAAISVRVAPNLKESLEATAKREGRSLASYVERLLTRHEMMPEWILRDANPSNRAERGPHVSLSIAEGWPTASLPADHAEALGRQLIRAAEIARGLPPAE